MNEEQDEVLKLHAMYLTQGASAITEEGRLLESIQVTGEEDPPLDDYITNMERLIRTRMERDRELFDRLQRLKKCMKDEEETHSKVMTMSKIIFPHAKA